MAKAKAAGLYNEPEESKFLARELPARGEWEEAPPSEAILTRGMRSFIFIVGKDL